MQEAESGGLKVETKKVEFLVNRSGALCLCENEHTHSQRVLISLGNGRK